MGYSKRGIAILSIPVAIQVSSIRIRIEPRDLW